MTLHEIGLKYGTDKSTNHNFTPYYDSYLSYLRDQNINLLEIGISEGLSLKMWEEYFQNGLIVGVDILERSYMNTDRISTMVINQEKPDELLSIPGEFDIIIDDGGHTMFQQQLTLKTILGPKLKYDGIYILEDLHTSKDRYFNSHGSNDLNNTLNLLEDLKNNKLRENNQYFINKTDFNSLLNLIESIEIIKTGEYSVTSIIKKNSK
jgi:hypothetical protein